METKTKQKSKTTYFLIVGVSTAILLVTPVLILVALGYFMDSLLHTAPILLIVGGVIGFSSGIYNVYRLMTKMK